MKNAACLHATAAYENAFTAFARSLHATEGGKKITVLVLRFNLNLIAPGVFCRHLTRKVAVRIFQQILGRVECVDCTSSVEHEDLV